MKSASDIDVALDHDARFTEMDLEFRRAQRRETQPVSDYALANYKEWFAEAFMFFYANPAHLRRMGPGSYRVLEALAA